MAEDPFIVALAQLQKFRGEFGGRLEALIEANPRNALLLRAVANLNMGLVNLFIALDPEVQAKIEVIKPGLGSVLDSYEANIKIMELLEDLGEATAEAGRFSNKITQLNQRLEQEIAAKETALQVTQARDTQIRDILTQLNWLQDHLQTANQLVFDLQSVPVDQGLAMEQSAETGEDSPKLDKILTLLKEIKDKDQVAPVAPEVLENLRNGLVEILHSVMSDKISYFRTNLHRGTWVSPVQISKAEQLVGHYEDLKGYLLVSSHPHLQGKVDGLKRAIADVRERGLLGVTGSDHGPVVRPPAEPSVVPLQAESAPEEVDPEAGAIDPVNSRRLRRKEHLEHIDPDEDGDDDDEEWRSSQSRRGYSRRPRY